MRKQIGSLVVALALATILAPGLVVAATIDYNSGTVDWTGATPCPQINCVNTNINLNVTTGTFTDVRWGVPVPPTGDQSGLGFDPAAPPQVVNVPSPFFLGTLRHYNNPIQVNSVASGFDNTSIVSADLDLTLDLTAHDGLNTTNVTPTFHFTFSINETFNPGPCPVGGPPCADIITFNNPPDQVFITVGGQQLILELLGFASSSDCSGLLTDEFVSQEGSTNDAFLCAQFAQRVIETPNPGALLLMGVGLLGLGGAWWRRSQA